MSNLTREQVVYLIDRLRSANDPQMYDALLGQFDAHDDALRTRCEAAEREIERIVTTPLATQLLNENHRLEEERETLKSQLATETRYADETEAQLCVMRDRRDFFKQHLTTVTQERDEAQGRLSMVKHNAQQQLATAQDEARRLREAIEDLTTGRRGSELHDVGSIMRHLRQAITPPATEEA